MLQALKQWFGFTRKKEAKDENNLAVCLRTLAQAPSTTSLQDKTIVVCKGAELKLRKKGALPDRLNPGEVCWILPSGDIRLPITFHYDAKEIQAVVLLRFEGDHHFVLYAANLVASKRECITKADLAEFVAGQWTELSTLQRIEPQQLQNPAVIARFRPHLSLLLQENGFRCVGIEAIDVGSTKISESLDAELSDAATQELSEAVKKVKSESDWHQLLDQLDDAGFQPRESDIETLESLGNDYCNRKVPAEDALLQIRRMIERNNLEIGLITERVARWNATEVKLRLLNSQDDKPAEYFLLAANFPAKPDKVPSTWYMLRCHKIDEKLQKYLKTTTGNLINLLDVALKRQTSIENKSKLFSSQSSLRRIADKLAITPGLHSGSRSLQSRQRGIDELIQAVRRSITIIQLAEGMLRNLVSKDYTREQYFSMAADLEATLTTLEREIDDRKNIYGIM